MDTLLSQTLKVEEKKVPLVFLFVAQGARYEHFSHLMIPRSSIPKFQKIIWPYLSSWATNKKLRTRSFLQLLKFEKAKCPYFFIYGPGAKIWALSPLDDTTYFTSQVSKDEMAISRLRGHK